jgi:hypothetical protein
MKAFLLLLICIPSLVLAEARELFWEDLLPPDYVQPDIPISHDGSMMQLNLDAPVVTELNGQKVKIPGFVVPLEGDDKLTTEFLLVPFFGACIHVPPPPPNQIVYVKFSKGVPIDNLYDAVWITGTLSTEGWSGDIATVGYSLTGISVAPFEG